MSEGRVFKRCPHGYTGGDTEVRACPKPHGSWYFDAEAPRDPETGRRRRHVVGGHPTKDEAHEALVAYLGRRNAGQWRDDRAMTVDEALTKWLAGGRWEALTLATYEGHVESIWRKRIGHLRLRNLRRHHVEDVLRDVAVDGSGRRRAPRTLASYRATLRAFLAWCVEEGLLGQNVAAGRLRALPAAGKAELRIWEPAELRLFLGATTGDTLSPMWRLAAFTGLRRSELCGLRWVDVDTTGKHPGVTVRQVVVALAGQHACPTCGGEHTGAIVKPRPKSDAGARWVPLVTEAVAALDDQRAGQEAQRKPWGTDYSDHDLVFAREDGTPLNPSSVTHRFGAAVAGVRHPADPAYRLPALRGPHDMRHGAASLMAAGGVPLETVALILGHSSAAVTRAIYTHTLRGPAAAALEAAAGLVRSGTVSADGRAQDVHRTPSSSEPEGVRTPFPSRSEAQTREVDPDRHCMTNSVKYTS
jgi:integrase